MTKSELKEIIKECYSEIMNENSNIVEESVDINTVNEDSILIDKAEYMDFVYESILVENIVGEYDTFNDICKSLIDESFSIVNEGVVQKIKDVIDRFIRWIKEKVIPFFKNIIPNIIKKNNEKLEKAAEAAVEKQFSFTREDIDELKSEFPETNGNAVLLKDNLKNKVRNDFVEIGKIVEDAIKGNKDDVDFRMNNLKNKTLFNGYTSKSIEFDFANMLPNEYKTIIQINVGDSMLKTLKNIENEDRKQLQITKYISDDVGTLLKELYACKEMLSRVTTVDNNIGKVVGDCLAIVNSYNGLMIWSSKFTSRYIEKLFTILKSKGIEI